MNFSVMMTGHACYLCYTNSMKKYANKGVFAYNNTKTTKKRYGFTIIELLVVVVVIAILAAIVTVAYNGVTSQAREAALKSDLQTAVKQLLNTHIRTGDYPTDTSSLKKQDTTTFTYSYDNTARTFCLGVASSLLPSVTYHATESGAISEGGCTPSTLFLQAITPANCPTERTRATDARDGHTYWVQKLADGKCWMLTNLAYAGGGSNTYGDVISTSLLTQGTTAMIRTEAKYYIFPGANVTSGSTDPSTATDGNGQYGYHYNWCAAMGAQLGTDACSSTDTTDVIVTQTICPSGWRLPTGGIGSEFIALNAAVNSGLGNTDLGLRTNWLGQRAGYLWAGTASYQGSRGVYWSSTLSSAAFARAMLYTATSVTITSNTATIENTHSVRCIAY